MVLVVLAAIWAAVLVPPYLQKRRATHPSSSITHFHQQLAVLHRTALHEGYASRQAPAMPSTAMPPVSRAPLGYTDVMRRRRDVFTTLGFASGLTFLLALAFGGNVWLLHLVCDALFLGYIALLLQIQQTRRPAAPRASVHYLPAARQPSATQQALLRRSAN